MSELLGTPGEYEKIQQELHGVIFKDPMTQGSEETGWVTADEYLSGNVREKLRVAELAAASDPAFAVNMEYLRKAQPKDLMHRRLMCALVPHGSIGIISSSL